jgi:uncharacterized protein
MVGYGLAIKPIDQDREALALDMTRHGFGPKETAKALEIGKAAETILRSGFQSGYRELAALRETYRNEPWLPCVRGNVTRLMIETPEATLREIGPAAFNGIRPDHDPMPCSRHWKRPALDTRRPGHRRSVRRNLSSTEKTAGRRQAGIDRDLPPCRTRPPCPR